MIAPRFVPTLLTTLWVVAIGAGFGALLDFDTRPGEAGDPPTVWPPDSAIPRRSGAAELLMILHPHCPCSRASLAELERLVARCGRRLDVHVLLYAPAEAGPAWSDTDSRRRAEAIPDVDVIVDTDGAEQRRFALRTSGHVLLYDAHGALQFSGGITASRGHEGDSLGSDAILSLVNAPADVAPMARRASPIFGCPLEEIDACSRK